MYTTIYDIACYGTERMRPDELKCAVMTGEYSRLFFFFQPSGQIKQKKNEENQIFLFSLFGVEDKLDVQMEYWNIGLQWNQPNVSAHLNV